VSVVKESSPGKQPGIVDDELTGCPPAGVNTGQYALLDIQAEQEQLLLRGLEKEEATMKRCDAFDVGSGVPPSCDVIERRYVHLSAVPVLRWVGIVAVAVLPADLPVAVMDGVLGPLSACDFATALDRTLLQAMGGYEVPIHLINPAAAVRVRGRMDPALPCRHVPLLVRVTATTWNRGASLQHTRRFRSIDCNGRSGRPPIDALDECAAQVVRTYMNMK
jgi:hypothetical protein